jgi:hypothetical protein
MCDYRPSKSEVRSIGTYRNVCLQVAAWDSVSAPVDLAISAMFQREMPGTRLGGGLSHLDNALRGAVVTLRQSGIFHGNEGETLMLSAPPAPIKAKAVLLVGAGDPISWTVETAYRTASTAMRTALRLGSASAAFAPSLLDSGLDHIATAGAAEGFMRGCLSALDDHAQTPAASPLRRWVFDAGLAQLDGATAEFRGAFAEHTG